MQGVVAREVDRLLKGTEDSEAVVNKFGQALFFRRGMKTEAHAIPNRALLVAMERVSTSSEMNQTKLERGLMRLT